MAFSARSPLRIGALGAARITPGALVQPAAARDDVELAAVAARDPGRARAFAEQHRIPRALDDYDALVRDPDIDAVYIGLPNGLHLEWALRALACGKHVLCEKPLAGNRGEAEEMVAAAEKSGRLLMEAYHWRYHPLAARWKAHLDAGAIGRIEHFRGFFTAPIPEGDIRFDPALAGGATMDLGCYPLQWARFAFGAEPTVARAEVVEDPAGIDRHMHALLEGPGGASGEMECSMLRGAGFSAGLEIRGSEGALRVSNPMAPQLGHALVVENADGILREDVSEGTTYEHQLAAFVGALESGEAPPTSGADSIATMELIDACYRAAGLRPRASVGRG